MQPLPKRTILEKSNGAAATVFNPSMFHYQQALANMQLQQPAFIPTGESIHTLAPLGHSPDSVYLTVQVGDTLDSWSLGTWFLKKFFFFFFLMWGNQVIWWDKGSYRCSNRMHAVSVEGFSDYVYMRTSFLLSNKTLFSGNIQRMFRLDIPNVAFLMKTWGSSIIQVLGALSWHNQGF